MSKENNQLTLFEMKEWWRDDWEGMPEFIQKDLTSHRKIVVHFRNNKDVKEFANIIKQTITPKQPSLWYPHMPPRRCASKRYIDES